VEIVEKDFGIPCTRVYFVGYNFCSINTFDEWKLKEEIIALGEDADEDINGVGLTTSSVSLRYG
jgi:hypothetical protein